MITHKNKDEDINKAQAMLFIAGDWKKDNTYFFEREILLNDTVEKCLIKAIENYKHIINIWKIIRRIKQWLEKEHKV